MKLAGKVRKWRSEAKLRQEQRSTDRLEKRRSAEAEARRSSHKTTWRGDGGGGAGT
jgi:hypothetical protein